MTHGKNVRRKICEVFKIIPEAKRPFGEPRKDEWKKMKTI
jgi:hypothetical protein